MRLLTLAIVIATSSACGNGKFSGSGENRTDPKPATPARNDGEAPATPGKSDDKTPATTPVAGDADQPGPIGSNLTAEEQQIAQSCVQDFGRTTLDAAALANPRRMVVTAKDGALQAQDDAGFDEPELVLVRIDASTGSLSDVRLGNDKAYYCLYSEATLGSLVLIDVACKAKVNSNNVKASAGSMIDLSRDDDC